ncbi:16743_t:CDS:10, partial [Racocetra fulgida]
MDEPIFKLPEIIDNENGWGPSPAMLPEKFRDIPYAPYSKADKLGRIADWSTPEQKEKETTGRARANYRYRAHGKLVHFIQILMVRPFVCTVDQYTAYGYGASSAFSYTHAEDEASFSVVDNRSAAQKKGSYRTTGGTKVLSHKERTSGNKTAAANVKRRFGWKDYDKPQRARDASVNVGPEWQVLEEIEFNRLSKLNLDVDEGEDMYLAKDDEATIFATDTILSLLMCAPRSVYPWDIVINHYVTVNENAADPPIETGDKDNINSPVALSMEATIINHCFAMQVVNESEKYEFEKPNPFASSDDLEFMAPCAYRYRRFDLGISEEEDVRLIVRTQLDSAVKTPAGDDSYITIKALNEFDSRSQGAGGALDWRQKLDTQRGAVVATEMKNNSCKLARWAVQSILAGADQMKLGYVSRASPKDNRRHVILGTQYYKPRDFAAQMNMSVSNGWGIVRTVIDLCMKLPEGRYVLLKDPNKPVVRLYSVPPNTFEVEDTLDEGDELEEDEDDLIETRYIRQVY